MPIQFDQLQAPLNLQSPKIRKQIAPILDYTQGFILEKHRRDFVANILLRFSSTDLPKIRRALASLPAALKIPSVAQLLAEGVAIRASLAAGLPVAALPAIAFAGLSAHGVAALALRFPSMPIAFRQGFKSRLISMPGRADTSAWHQPWASAPVDALIVIAAASASDLAQATSALRTHWQSIAKIDVESGSVLRLPSANPLEKGTPIEHFGFADGNSQPEFFIGKNTRTPAWKSTFDPAMNLARILVPEKLPVQSADRFGSYLAYLKIEQHLDRFKAATARLSTSACPMSKVQAGQMIMGRTREGKQLVHPSRHENDFSADDDPKGVKWPFASHTRKMNSRESGEAATRILRRGVPYEEGNQKGLLFQSFQASLQDQFEEIYFNWADQPHHPEDETGSDPVIGRTLETPLKFPSTCPRGIKIADLTTLRGGEYFYFPSITALQSLS